MLSGHDTATAQIIYYIVASLGCYTTYTRSVAIQEEGLHAMLTENVTMYITAILRNTSAPFLSNLVEPYHARMVLHNIGTNCGNCTLGGKHAHHIPVIVCSIQVFWYTTLELGIYAFASIYHIGGLGLYVFHVSQAKYAILISTIYGLYHHSIGDFGIERQNQGAPLVSHLHLEWYDGSGLQIE